MTLGTAPTPARRGFLPSRPLALALTILLALFLFTAAILAVLRAVDDDGTIQGSGVAATETRTTEPFSAVDLRGTNDVAITVGPKQSIVVHADDNLIDRVTTVADSGQLAVSTRGSMTTESPMYVEITLPALDSITLSGTGMLGVRGVDTGELTVALPGTGTVSVSGNAGRVEADMAGTGDLRLANLEARHADVTLSGTGRIEVHATRTLRASLPGTGSIFYSGNPARVVKSLTGTGAILPR